MSRRRQTRAIQKFFRKYLKQILQLAVSMTKAMFQWLLRTLMVTQHRRYQTARAGGFVLPTVAMLLVVVALVIGAILFRTSSRTNQVITERNQQVIYNAATPAIDRAKAKLEYLFKRDERLPNTVPSEAQLMSALLNDGQNNITQLRPDQNPYEFPDEDPIQIAGQNAPAWKYQTDIDGDGKKETVAYSILLKTRDSLDPNASASVTRESADLKQKANNLVVRNGPITTQKAADPDCDRLNLAPEQGWDLAGTGSLRKTFQVTAAVISNKNANRTVTTLEFQQDRELARANKWGAWTRYDLHLYPFPPFRWNGAMHSEGSFFLGGQNSDSIQSYLISARKSCLYSPASNSEISIGRVKNASNQIEFAGQIVKGSIGGTPSQDATVHIFGDPPTTNNKIGDTTDSVNGGGVGVAQAELMAMNPITLFTQDLSRSVSTANNSNNTGFSTPNWLNKEQLTNNTRIIAKTEKPPYVDDTYRADDRLGPKPKYDLEGENNDVSLGTGLKNGITINNAPGLSATQKEQLTRNDPRPNDVEFRTIGLDGYWERRARAEGLRILVGPRLELGNPFGWVQDPNGNGTPYETTAPEVTQLDPLYPIYKSGISGSIPHLQQQRRTLRDNLAAVQATAVYHYTQNNGDLPVACVATAAHPGTQQTIDNSKDFSSARAFYGDPNGPYSDFFSGRGTNGWEYKFDAQPGDFTGGPLYNALRNLANFAGDYENINNSGAFPPTQGTRVYPDPYLTMWGNFSNLRRAIQDPARNPQTGQPSIADQSYMHTAGCALGMLANNVKYFNDYTYTGSLQPVADALVNLFDTNPANGEVKIDNTTGRITEIWQDSPPAGVSNPLVQGASIAPTPDAFISALSPTNQQLARRVMMKEQISRDRKYGFYTSSASPISDTTAVDFDVDGDSTTTPNNDVLKLLPSSVSSACDATTFTGIAKGNALRLLCPSQPKFPSLHYIFPDTTVPNSNRTIQSIPPGQPNLDNVEPYINQTKGLPVAWAFTAINNADLTAIADKFKPSDVGSWKLPTAGGPSMTTGNANADQAFRVKHPNGGDLYLYVPFVDKGIFDGREMMSLRVLDIDLERLRTTSIGADNWFSKGGIFYAFREDAVREDGIARPSGGAYTDPENPVRTNATNPADPKDPQVSTTTGISPKPVDFYPDPDRRPYGFRLRNGALLRRQDTNNPRGITFVSDNLVAIQGNFNLHNQEEFSDTLSDDWSNFYSRQSLNTNFASLQGDTWRPAEILADGITLLSNDFTDGNIEVGLRDAQINGINHSYRGLGNSNTGNNWVREDNSSANGSTASPIKIFRDGNPRNCTGAVTGSLGFCPTNPTNQQVAVSPNVDFNTDTRRNNLNAATNNTQINAIMVSGVIPARENQGNGGFHNFPRLLETWDGRNLRIAGSFIQLNFSTSATGPYDQDAWEPNQNPDSAEKAFHFRPPNRLWGYDVGLQYAAAGPLSKRFITAETPRSEFYEELKASDPYVCNLRRAIATNNPEDATEDPAQVNQECQ